MPAEAELIFLAIRGAVRLGANMRQAFVEATQDRAVVLPLPDFNPQADEFRALNYFTQNTLGAKHPPAHERLRALLAKAAPDVRALSEDDKAELRGIYRDCYFLDHADAASELKDAARAEMIALVTVRQWRMGQNPNPSWAQRLAGSLIDIGADYLRTFPPEALRPGSKYERVATGFLDALADRSLGAATRAEWESLPGRLLTTALAAVAGAPELVTGDPALQELTKLAGLSLLGDAKARLDKAGDTQEAGSIAQWAEHIFHGLLATAGARAIADPGKFLGVRDAAAQSAVAKVGGAVLGLVLDTPGGVRLDALRTRAGLSTVLAAALDFAAEHPDALGADSAALQGLVSQAARDLDGVLGRVPGDVLPEVLRIVLRRTGENLPLFWPRSQAQPGASLGIAVAQAVFDAATRPPARAGAWRPDFSTAQLLGLLDHFLHELAANPGWIVDAAGRVAPEFGVAVGAVFDAVRRGGDARLTPDAALALARTAMAAVMARPEFARRLAGGDVFVGALVEQVLASVLDPKLPAADVPVALGRLVREDVVPRLLEEILDALQACVLADQRLTELKAFFEHWLPLWAGGVEIDWVAVDADLVRRFAT